MTYSLFVCKVVTPKKNDMENTNKFNEIRKNINLYLDKALNEEDQRKMMDEVNSNPDYSQMINEEKNFRNFIKNKVHRPQVSTELIQSIIKRVKLD